MLWHGAQRGVVAPAERRLHVQRPRLPDRSGREVHVPAYERLRDDANIGACIRDILVAGVSTRRYAQDLPEAAGTLRFPRARCRSASLRPAPRSLPNSTSAARQTWRSW